MPIEKLESIEEFFSSAANQRAVQSRIRNLYDLGLSVAHIGFGPTVERPRYFRDREVVEASKRGALSDIPFVGVGISPIQHGTIDFVFKR